MSQQTLYEEVKESADWILEQIPESPEIALILGSGLGGLCDDFDDAVALDYSDVPGFPESAVEGHAGRLVYGTLADRPVIAMQGRVHYYEGWSLERLTFPVRVFGLIDVDTLLVTNSAGGANPEYRPGDLMVITDHLNLMGANPLHGENDDRFGPRFPDMSYAYDPQVRETILEAADELDMSLRQGVYAANAGPTYETPAEVRMVQTIGGDAVGMSTVPEVIVANQSGMNVGGISCITNMAAGLTAERLDHSEVEETATRVREKFSALVR
ncbi:MAG: purine-nucleoside phosphorylase, partial [Persicimonas sp.]